MDFRTFVRIIRFRWKIVIAAIVACLIGAATITTLQAKQYQASAGILMSLAGATTINEYYEATQASHKRLLADTAIAGGPTVAQRAIDQLHVPMTADELVRKTHITYTPESLMFRLTVTDSDPERTAALAGAIADQFAAYVPQLQV